MENLNFLNDLGITTNEANNIEKIRGQLFRVIDLPGKTPTPEELGIFDPSVNIDENPGQRIYNSNGKRLGQTEGTYKSIQPVEFFDHIVNEIETTGATNIDLSKMSYSTFKDERIINFKIPTDTVNFNNRAGKPEEIKMYLNFETGFGGTAATELGLYSKRLICSNGLKIREGADWVKVKHTERMNAKIFVWAGHIARKISEVEKIGNVWKNMDRVTVTDKEIQDFIFNLANIKKGETLESQSTRTKNIVQSLKEATEIEMTEAGRSVWALLQGATRYTNHLHSKAGAEFIHTGTGATINAKAEAAANHLVQYA